MTQNDNIFKIKFRQNFNKTYKMVTPEERNIISEKCNKQILKSECKSGLRSKWWYKKHNPNNEIPTFIYLLGNGTIKELYQKYKKTNYKEYKIEWKEFINYTREMIKQGIML